MAECVLRTGLYDRSVLHTGINPVEVYSFYSGDKDTVFGELPERAGGIVLFFE